MTEALLHTLLAGLATGLGGLGGSLRRLPSQENLWAQPWDLRAG